MAKYYLRMEGVNLTNFIYDTQELSTIRGGSLLLLNAVDEVPEMVSSVRLHPITTGASSGLFWFDAPDDEGDIADKVRLEVQDGLNGNPDLKHATFVVDTLPVSHDFVKDREAILALNRWRQMRQPRLAVPKWNERQGINACRQDMVKPATETITRAEGPQLVSTSVKSRWEFGRDQKRKDFYKNQLNDIAPYRGFAQHFDELTNDPRTGNLHHKMAVIYLDGNGFGKLQNEKCPTPETLRDFDTAVKGYRQGLLRALLDLMENEKGWLSIDGRYRLETLLWGGDEIIWVVPAWKGWKILAFFYSKSQDWKFAGQRLTHAGGMVFCHHNAPIYRITALAMELADRAKRMSRDENLFAYQILESFDHVGTDLDRFRAEQCAPGENTDTLILPGEGMDDVAEAFTHLKNTSSQRFPRRKLYQLIKQMRADPDKAEDTIKETSKDIPTELQDTLRNYFGYNKTIWFHIAELWDYVGEQA